MQDWFDCSVAVAERVAHPTWREHHHRAVMRALTSLALDSHTNDYGPLRHAQD
jgi:hypothetical protein